MKSPASVFDNIDYLRTGTPRQQQAHQVLTDAGILEKLREYTPILAGTIPLAINMETSDLDILCCWSHKHRFVDSIIHHFSDEQHFTLQEKTIAGHETVLAGFETGGFLIEIFGQNRPVREQEGYRHMIIEYELLNTHGSDFREAVMALKKAGVKTEPAFAHLLGLQGDPYAALLTYTPAK
jgi:hypothetical protein